MRRFIIKILLIAVLPVVAVMLRMLLITDDYSRRSHGVNVRLAYNKLDKLSGTQKIVIIAGSNGGFGFNSKILSDSMRMPVVRQKYVHAHSKMCDSGRKQSERSVSSTGRTLAWVSIWQSKLAWVRITPLGSPVVPEV